MTASARSHSDPKTRSTSCTDSSSRAPTSKALSRASELAALGRVLGIDYGERRIGLAVSDPTGTIASPLPTLLRRAGKRAPLSRLEEVARGHGVEGLVVGLPLDLRGRETQWCAEVREACDKLAKRLDVPVTYVDERLTTRQAERAVRGMGLKKREREQKERVDAAAAALILQSWLDGRKA